MNYETQVLLPDQVQSFNLRALHSKRQGSVCFYILNRLDYGLISIMLDISLRLFV